MNDSQDPDLTRIVNDPSRMLLQRVQAHGDRLNEATPAVDIAFRPGHPMTAVRTGGHVTAEGLVVWEGVWDRSEDWQRAGHGTHPLDDVANQVTLISNHDLIIGTAQIDGDRFMIQPLRSGGHAFTAIDEHRLSIDHPDGEPLIDTSHKRVPTMAPSAGIDARVMIVFPTTSDDYPIMDLLFANLMVAEANRSFINSDIDHRLELAAVTHHAYRASGDLRTDLRRLTSTDDEFLPGVHADRDTYAADLVSLIVDRGELCGTAYLKATAATAFSVVQLDCAIGNATFAHEIGHNYGAHHDPANGHNSEYAYGHGYQLPVLRARTIMAYDCPAGCPRVQLWSSPLIYMLTFFPMGNAYESDNRRVLNERAATVAAFR